ncbi:MAG: GNAT family N-acetyltransferase [Oscillospiraceae bacterium]
MNITVATNEMIPALSSLWRCAFGDSQDYIDLFFARRFPTARGMVVMDGMRPLSMLFLLPLTVASGDRFWNARYLYAVATDPDAQGQGLSTALLSQTHRLLEMQGVDLSFLVPATSSLFDYYGARGFDTQFYLSKQVLSADPMGEMQPLTRVTLSKMRPLRDRCFANCALFARWDEKALDYQDLEASFSGGETLKFQTDMGIGYALCIPSHNTVWIKELAAVGNLTPIYNAIAHRYGCAQMEIRRPARTIQTAVPFGMARWYTAPPSGEGEYLPYLSLVLD